MKTGLFLFAILFLLVIPTHAQTDNEFWFAAPDVSSVHGEEPDNGAPLRLHMIAMENTTVTIERPADTSFIPINIDLLENENYSIRLDDTVIGLSISDIEVYPSPDLNTPQKKGFKISSSHGNISCTYELDNQYNRELFSLKGENALGKKFYVSTQNKWPNGNYSGTVWSGFIIVATEDSTEITIQQNSPWLYFETPAPRTLILNEGETFAFRSNSTDAEFHINGVFVSSDKNIAITVYDDSVHPIPHGCKDIIGDQIVPVENIGKSYIVNKGFLNFNDEIFITATVNATDIYVNDTFVVTVDSGDVVNVTIPDSITKVYTSEPSYVNHITGFGCETGMTLLPPLDVCKGSSKVSFSQPNNDPFYFMLCVANDTNSTSSYKNKSVESFTISDDTNTYEIDKSYFIFTPDSTFAIFKKNITSIAFINQIIQPGETIEITNNSAPFYFGVITGTATRGAKYTYFANYSESKSGSASIGGTNPITELEICGIDSVELVASNGLNYLWYSNDTLNASSYITDTTIANPYFYPPYEGSYSFAVNILNMCFETDTINMNIQVEEKTISAFTISEDTMCSGSEVLVQNNSQGYRGNQYWIIDGDEIVQDTIPMSFNISFNNETDSIIPKIISLRSFADPFFSCPDMLTDSVLVAPNPVADIWISDTSGISPLEVNMSSGMVRLGTTFYWEFLDTTIYQNPFPSAIFSSNDTTVHPLHFSITNKFGCSDSITKYITVFTPVGFNEVESLSLESYYNSGQNQLYIDLSNQASFNNAHLKLLSVDGKTYFTNHKLKNGQNVFSVDLAEGIYILFIQIDNRHYSSKFLVSK